MIVNRVGPLSCAKVVGLLYVILGLIMGAFVSLFAVTMGGVPGRDPGNPVFGMAAVVFFPVLYGVAGFVTTLIAAWLYNGLAGLVGGVEIDLR
ncbi:MAG TPA: hypothetical protein VKH83_15950 [Methylomirabilota bacterium]|nr:hypothetical protein [Methylomirabilota bacterium]